MYTHIGPAMGSRSKGSFSLDDFYYFNDRTECSSSYWRSPFLIHGFTINPRILYGLRQSTLIQWSASKRLILGGNCGSGCNRLAATVAICDHDRRNWVYCPLKERRREWRATCMDWGREGCDSSGGERVDEMISLLEDVVSRDSVSVRERNSKSAAESVRATHIRRRGVFDKEKVVRVDNCSKKEVNYMGHDSGEGNSKGEVVIKSVEGYREEGSSREDKYKVRKVDRRSRREEQYLESDSLERKSKGEVVIKSAMEGNRQSRRREDFSREDNREARKDTSSSSYYSISSSVDLESNMESLQFKPERVIEESSSGYKNDFRQERKDVSMEEVKQLEKYESNMKYGESSRKRNTKMQSMKQEDREKFNLMEDDVDEWDSEKASEKRSEVLGFQESDIQRASRSENRSKMRMDREDSSTSSMYLVHGAKEQYIEKDRQVVGQKDIRKESQKLNRTSERHEGNSQGSSSSQTMFNSRIKYREEETASDVNLVEETRDHRVRTEQRVGGQNKSRNRSQNLTEVSEIHDADIDRTFPPQRLFKTRVNDVHDDSMLVLKSIQQARDDRTQTDQAQTESIKEFQKFSGVSETHATDTKLVSISQRVSKARTHDQEESSASILNQVQEALEQHRQTDEQVIRQRGSRKESQRHTVRSEFHDRDIERATSSSQTLVKTRVKDRAESSMSVLSPVQEAREQQMDASNMESRNSQVMVTLPQSELVVSGLPAHDERVDENIDGGSSALYTRLRGNNPATLHELDDRIQTGEMHARHSELVVNDGALDSVRRLDISSAQIVGEFVDMLQQEVSTSHQLSMASKHTSKTQKESTSSATASVSQDEKCTRQSSRRFSTGSVTKGPSDEMWESSSLDPSRAEELKKGPSMTEIVEPTVETNAENVTVRRSSRSLWSYIADIVRKGWGSRAESHAPTMKSGARSSSNESLNSESWFSGHESDHGDDENAKKGKSGMLKEPSLATQTQQASKVMSSQDKLARAESDALASIGILERGSGFKDSPLVSGKGDFEQIKEAKEEGIPSSVVFVDTSFPSAGISSSSRPVTASERGEISESQEAQMSRSGLTELDEEPVREGATEATGTEGKDGNLKRRKLQRNKQVLRERFDEWEEAFRLEHEQRKTDELFMREALLEAKKAADSWEVPVGAVLVQNGKIIARGYNLVEQLRDSTAHAELICIREASNLLRTWRLAETTLYVTLEPCPMCAGAILQARVDTVVWGAPNKLLGADGSWVSLFPGGEEGRDGSDRPAGPVHPFHPKITIRRGILATECSDIMQQFFQLRRKNKKSESPPSRLPVSNHPSKFFSKVHDVFNMMFCL